MQFLGEEQSVLSVFLDEWTGIWVTDTVDKCQTTTCTYHHMYCTVVTPLEPTCLSQFSSISYCCMAIWKVMIAFIQFLKALSVKVWTLNRPCKLSLQQILPYWQPDIISFVKVYMGKQKHHGYFSNQPCPLSIGKPVTWICTCRPSIL